MEPELRIRVGRGGRIGLDPRVEMRRKDDRRVLQLRPKRRVGLERRGECGDAEVECICRGKFGQ